VRNEFFPFRLTVCAVCLFSLFGLRANAQDRDNDRKNEHPEGIVQDWSRHHVVFPRVGPIQSLIAVQHDRRAILSWQEAEREDWHRERDRWRHHSHEAQDTIHRDWSIGLGGGTTAPAMYPAKFTFDLNATANCLSDFIVFPVNVAGGAAQPNIVGFNNLYSGTAGGTGICNAPANGRTAGANDNGTSATTIWSYNVTAGGGVVATSPALSIDGTKVAFVETGGGAAHFHVLAPNNGDGVAANLQTVTSPAQITSGFVSVTPAAGQATDLTLGSANDTLSSPFIDYVNDTAYVGNDAGVLFRVKNVFCTTTACTGAGSPAPSLDTTWGSGGSVTIGGTCTGKLTGPVAAINGSVYVGCADGKLYGFDSTGTPFTTPSITVGNGSATGGIVDPPLVDVVNKFIYVVSGNDGTNSVLVQVASDFSSSVKATYGTGGLFNVHLPSFNEAYFTSAFSTVANVQGSTSGGVTTTGSTSNWQIYNWVDSGDSVNGLATVYGVGFNNLHVMTAGAAANFFKLSGSVSTEWSPTTELLNGGNDRLFVSALEGSAPPNFFAYLINSAPNAYPPTGGATATEGSGTSAIVVDNVSASAQASSIYFGAQVANTAVKLTQSGLN
jgi:hypothetical protein